MKHAANAAERRGDSVYLITDPEGVILCITPDITYQRNGNPVVKGGTYAIAAGLIGAIYRDVPIPDGVGEQTHIYKDGKFSENTAHEPEEPTPEEQLAEAQEALRILGYNSANEVTA